MTALKDLLHDIALLNRVPVEEIPSVLGELEMLRARLWARLMSLNGDAPRAELDKRLNVEEASQMLGMSTDYLYRHSDKFPFTVKIGRSIGFSQVGIERFLRQRAGR